MPTATRSATTATARRTRRRVTSRTPHAASSTSASAPASGTSPVDPPASGYLRPGTTNPPPTAAHGWWPATAARAPDASPSTTTDAKVFRASAIGRQQHVGVEAAALPRVAGRALLLHLHQQRVAVAV